MTSFGNDNDDNQHKTVTPDMVNHTSRQWQLAFNSGDAACCASHYEKDAIMHARPFGTFRGVRQIQKFWQKIIDDGFSDVRYIKPKIKIIDKTSAILTSDWKMNRASGTIHRELWVLQSDGTVKLREDDFEVI